MFARPMIPIQLLLTLLLLYCTTELTHQIPFSIPQPLRGLFHRFRTNHSLKCCHRCFRAFVVGALTRWGFIFVPQLVYACEFDCPSIVITVIWPKVSQHLAGTITSRVLQSLWRVTVLFVPARPALTRQRHSNTGPAAATIYVLALSTRSRCRRRHNKPAKLVSGVDPQTSQPFRYLGNIRPPRVSIATNLRYKPYPRPTTPFRHVERTAAGLPMVYVAKLPSYRLTSQPLQWPGSTANATTRNLRRN